VIREEPIKLYFFLDESSVGTTDHREGFNPGTFFNSQFFNWGFSYCSVESEIISESWFSGRQVKIVSQKRQVESEIISGWWFSGKQVKIVSQKRKKPILLDSI